LRSFGVWLCLAGVMCVVSLGPMVYALGTAWGRRQEVALKSEMDKVGVPEYFSARIVLMMAPLTAGAILIVAGLPFIKQPTRRAQVAGERGGTKSTSPPIS
jgi:hypothetical protein